MRILEGTEIIREDEIVTQRHLEQLEALGLLRGVSGYPVFGLAFILLLLFLVVGFFVIFSGRQFIMIINVFSFWG